MSNPNTSIFFDLYLKLEMFTSRQKIFEFLKYFEKAAADAPAKDPISKILSKSFFLSTRCHQESYLKDINH